MKFRDPKTGEVFETIYAVYERFCCKNERCSKECPLHFAKSCSEFICEHQREAARLMGYEVIGCDVCAYSGRPTYKSPCSECRDYNKFEPKEENMEKKDKPLSEWTLKEAKDHCTKYWKEHGCDGCPFRCADGGCAIEAPSEWEIPSESSSAAKDTDTHCKPAKPRLAEVLGVEVGERFRVPGNGGTVTFWVTDAGYFDTDPPHLAGSTYMLLNAINHPESIIRAPRLTEAELAICKAVGAKWVSLDENGYGRVDLWGVRPEKTDFGNFVGSGVPARAHVVQDLFQSVKPGDCICVEEVEKEQ